MTDPIKDFLNTIKPEPVNFVEYDGCNITFYTWPEQLDYKVSALPDQLREFCEVEYPNELRELEKWIWNMGHYYGMTDIINDYISHSRHEWRQIIELENQN